MEWKFVSIVQFTAGGAGQESGIREIWLSPTFAGSFWL